MDYLEKYSLLFHFAIFRNGSTVRWQKFRIFKNLYVLKESVLKRVGKNIMFEFQNGYYHTEDTNEIVNIGLDAKSKYGNVLGYNSNINLIN